MRIVIGQKDRTHGVRIGAMLAGALLIGSILTGLLYTPSRATFSSTGPAAVGSQFQCEKGPIFIIGVDAAASPNYYATAGSSFGTVSCGQLVYGGPNNVGAATGTSLSSVLNKVMAANERIVFEVGTFVIDAALSYSVNNVVWECQGRATNFTETASFAANMLTVSGAFWTVNQCGFDGRNVLNSHSYALLKFTGSNDTVSNSYFNRGDHGLITVSGYGDKVLYNVVQDSTDDGIIVLGGATSNYITIQGNQVTEAIIATAYNCIAAVGPTVHLSVLDNSLRYCENAGVALENLGGAGDFNMNTMISRNDIAYAEADGVVIYAQLAGVDSADNVTISENIITYPDTSLTAGLAGVFLTSGSRISVLNNQIINSHANGIVVASGVTYNYLVIRGNTISQPVNRGISLAGTQPGVAIKDNQILGLFTNQRGIDIQGTSNDCLISGNLLTVTAAATSVNGILFEVAASNNCVVTGNSFIGVVANGNALYIDIGQTGTVVSSNNFDSWKRAVLEDNGGDYSLFFGNNMRTSIQTPFTLSGIHDVVSTNLGFNPVAVTTFTAMASVYTYTNNNGYDIQWFLTTVAGISAWSCNGITGLSIAAGASNCITPPGGTMTITWTVTAPVFKGVPLEA